MKKIPIGPCALALCLLVDCSKVSIGEKKTPEIAMVESAV